jgi:type VI secretion system protein ImpH
MRDALALCTQLEGWLARMDFFHVLRLIENAHPELPRLGTALRPRDEAVRFGQDPELIFHAGALGRYRAASAEGRARLAVNFFGLMGANGPLPTHITEYVRDRLRNAGDATLMAFLDVFHHRMVALFYRARATAEPVINLDREDDDRFSMFVGSLFGIGAPELRERDEIGDFAKLHFAGLLANKSRSASGLATILREYFQLSLHIEQFVGHWMHLPVPIQSRIGAVEQGNRLSSSMVLGRSVWDCQNKFRIVIGPMGFDSYQRFMPGGHSLQRLLAWVKSYVGLVLDWDVQLILQNQAIAPLRLGRAARLGRTTRLISRTPTTDCGQKLIRRSVIDSNSSQAPA